MRLSGIFATVILGTSLFSLVGTAKLADTRRTPPTESSGCGCGSSDQLASSPALGKAAVFRPADVKASQGSHDFATWFQAVGKGAYPSPKGAYVEEGDFGDGTYSATFPEGSGRAVPSSSGAQKFLQLSFSQGTANLSLTKLVIDPKADGRLQSIYGHFRLLAGGARDLQAQFVLQRNGVSLPVGLPQRLSVSPGRWVDVSLKTDLAVNELGTPGTAADFGCGSSPYSVAVQLKSGRVAEKGDPVEVDDLGVGVMSKCCGSSDMTLPKSAIASANGLRSVGLATPQTGMCCDDDQLPATVTVGADGEASFNVTPPPGADSDFDPYAEIVNFDGGDAATLFPNANMRDTTWLDNYPCQKAIGGFSPGQINNLIFSDPELQNQGVTLGQESGVNNYLASVEQGLENQQNQTDWKRSDLQDDLFKGGEAQWIPDDPHSAAWNTGKQGNAWAFYPGADIVYVHGLKLDHIKDLMGLGGSVGDVEPWLAAAGYSSLASRNAAVQVKWQTPTSITGPASSNNPSYYSGYFKKGAEYYWKDGENGLNQGHIPVFLGGQGGDTFVGGKTNGQGYGNRYLIVSYSCADGVEDASRAILRQIADAMKFGTGVVNPKSPGMTTGFGSRGIVIVSHSTGGLVTNAAMQLARRRAHWHAGWIADHVKLHVAAESAMSGSRMATAAIGGVAIVDAGLRAAIGLTGVPPQPVLAVLQLILDACGLPIPISHLTSTIEHSILMDLVPTVAQVRWGRFFLGIAQGGMMDFRDPSKYVPPTLCLNSNHPTQTGFFKYGFLEPGLDDGVVNANSSSGNPTLSWRWPSGFFGDPIGNFDMGIWLGNGTHTLVNTGHGFFSCGTIGTGLDHKKRSERYYLDMKDVSLDPSAYATNPDKVGVANVFWFAAGPDYRLAPDGMLQTYPSGADLYRHRVLMRYQNMFTAIASASDHYDGTIGSSGGIHWNSYQDTNRPTKIEPNQEETFVVGPNDGDVYRAYTPPAFPNATPLDPLSRPVLTNPLPQHFVTRGLRIWFKVFHHLHSYWLVRRHYLLLDGWENREQFDYVYWNALGGGR